MKRGTLIQIGRAVCMTTGILVLLTGLLPVQEAQAVDHPILYLFWGDGCPHCEEEKEFLEIVKQGYPHVEMRLFEVLASSGICDAS